MALPKAYLTSVKNLGAIFDAMRQAKAPERFTIKFLESLEFKSTSDRLVVGVLKSLGFLDDQGKPTSRYFDFLDQTQSDLIMAEAVREAYADLFQVNTSAQKLSRQEVINKFKTLAQGQLSESVLDKMALTFTGLVKLADFESQGRVKVNAPTNFLGNSNPDSSKDDDSGQADSFLSPQSGSSRSLGGLHYNIQIILPDSRDPKVYDALFRSLREHLF